MGNVKNHPDCPFRHENGNCLPHGGFCTSVPTTVCDDTLSNDMVSRCGVIALIRRYSGEIDKDDKNGLIARIQSMLPLRRTGKWEKIRGANGDTIAIRCTRCRRIPEHTTESPFCPNCGADMRDNVSE